MQSLNYLTPDEIRKSKDFLRKHLSDYEASLVIKSGLASDIIFKYSDRKSKVLDCGTGSGKFLDVLRQAGYLNLSAADIDNYLKDPTRVDFKVVDLSFDKLPWQNGYFDLVTAWQIVEHLENPHNFIREVSRALIPGGKLIFSMPNIQHVFNRIFFFRKGDMYRWHRKNNHIALFPKGLFQKTFLKYFDVVEKKFTDGEFPYRFLSRFNFPKNEIFGRDVVYILKKRI